MTTKVFTSQGERYLQAKALTVLFLVRDKYFPPVYAHLLELHALPPPLFYLALLVLAILHPQNILTVSTYMLCFCVGNIFSALLVSSLLPYGLELAMMACSFLMFVGAIIIFFCLPEHPDRVGENAGKKPMSLLLWQDLGSCDK